MIIVYFNYVILMLWPINAYTCFVTAGTLISHEKLLLQINTEREIGNMDYKLGQVWDSFDKR